MYARAKAEKAALENERAQYAAIAAKKTRGVQRPGTPEVFRQPEDIRNDERYQGQTTFLLQFVPIRTRDLQHEVNEETLRDWILYATVEEDAVAQKYDKEMDKIAGVIDLIDKNLMKIPKLEFLDDDGKPYTVDRAREEREALYSQLNNQRVAAEEDIDKAQRNKANHIAWRKSTGVDLEKGDEDKNTDTCTWFVRMYGTEDVKFMEDKLIDKDDWAGIALANGLPFAEPPIPPWVGRTKMVPDGSKANDATDYSPLQVNIAGCRISRVPQGVGMMRMLDRESTKIYAEEFGVFYGDFEAGKKHGYGIEIDDVSTFTGAYEKGWRQGRGRTDLADGTTMTGTYGVTLQRRAPESRAFENPYKEGELQGDVEIYFGDGAFYKGQAVNGRVVGQGDYQSAFNEVLSGPFDNGVLHGPKCFQQNQIEEVFMGDFRHGEMHGRGTYQNKRGDNYEGFWKHNMRHGRGVHYFARSGCYRGYFVNNLKHGKGSLEYGYSKSRLLGKKSRVAEALEKEREEKAKKNEKEATFKEKELSDFNNIYQGFFIGNKMSNRGSLMHTVVQSPSIISKLDNRGTAGILKVLVRDDRQQKSSARDLERLNDMEGHIREEIANKKIKIFKQQKHFTKKTMYMSDVFDDKGCVSQQQLESKLLVRSERLKNLNGENHHFKKALIPRLKLPNNAPNEVLSKAFLRIRPDKGDNVEKGDRVDEKLLKVILTDFDEVVERHRFLKYDRIWVRAEAAFIGGRTAAV